MKLVERLLVGTRNDEEIVWKFKFKIIGDSEDPEGELSLYNHFV